jgi:hypothetical protein
MSGMYYLEYRSFTNETFYLTGQQAGMVRAVPPTLVGISLLFSACQATSTSVRITSIRQTKRIRRRHDEREGSLFGLRIGRTRLCKVVRSSGRITTVKRCTERVDGHQQVAVGPASGLFLLPTSGTPTRNRRVTWISKQENWYYP